VWLAAPSGRGARSFHAPRRPAPGPNPAAILIPQGGLMFNRFPRTAAPAAALALLAACADQPASPGAPATVRGAPSFATAPSGAQLIRNTVRYSDTGQKPATGRAGSAAITARALIGSDLRTELEVTARSADPLSTAQASLQKVRVNAIDHNGAQLFETNYTGLAGPTFTKSFDRLSWGMTLRVKANVTGVDHNRTDLVDATVPVLLRPDLAVYLFTTNRIRAGTPVPFTAYVLEGNGQVGALADCGLYVDGTRVDIARDVWVDAQGVVTCAFTHTFADAGRRLVEVRAENVRPGDWDTANNASATYVEVQAVGNHFSDAFASSTDNYTHSAWEYTWLDRMTGNGGEDSSASTHHTRQQYGLAYGSFQAGLRAPFTVTGTQTTSGNPVNTTSFTVNAAAGSDCYSHFDGSAASFLYVCTDISPYSPYTTFRYDRSAGTVTYHSRQYSRSWDGLTGEEYVYNYNYEFASQEGTLVPFGTDYTFAVQFATADSTFTTSITLPLRFQENNQNPGTVCNGSDDEYWFWHACSTYESRNSGLTGRWPDYPW
jgi:hypothetical protein